MNLRVPMDIMQGFILWKALTEELVNTPATGHQLIGYVKGCISNLEEEK